MTLKIRGRKSKQKVFRAKKRTVQRDPRLEGYENKEGVEWLSAQLALQQDPRLEGYENLPGHSMTHRAG